LDVRWTSSARIGEVWNARRALTPNPPGRAGPGGRRTGRAAARPYGGDMGVRSDRTPARRAHHGARRTRTLRVRTATKWECGVPSPRPASRTTERHDMGTRGRIRTGWPVCHSRAGVSRPHQFMWFIWGTRPSASPPGWWPPHMATRARVYLTVPPNPLSDARDPGPLTQSGSHFAQLYGRYMAGHARGPCESTDSARTERDTMPGVLSCVR
jgi:hypothetical protein